MNDSGCHSDHRLNESTVPIPSTQDVTPTIHTALALPTRPRRINQATPGSSNAIEGVVAASTSNRKNRVPITRPPGISVNTRGRTSNTNAGPCAGFIPYPNTNGKIITVASTETSSIDPVITSEVRTNEVPRSTYAPKAIIMACPTPVA